MKKKRLFIAVNLDYKIKNQLYVYKNKLKKVPAKWTKKENLHITLLFLGNVEEKYVSDLIKIIQSILLDFDLLNLEIKKIIYGPPKSNRMIWALLDYSKDLDDIKNRLNENIIKLNIKGYKSDNRKFLPHITLARIKSNEFYRLSKREIPVVNEKVSYNIEVKSIDLMESILKSDGPEYYKVYNH